MDRIVESESTDDGSSPSSPTICGKPAASLVPRWGWYFACYLPPNHEGECQPGGDCIAHGRYIGSRCPRWPECVKAAVETVVKNRLTRESPDGNV